MKHYNKFFEKGCNAYYIAKFGDSECLGIESFILCKGRFGSKKKITQLFKILELSSWIQILLNNVASMTCLECNKEYPDMNRYNIPSELQITSDLKSAYNLVKSEQLVQLEEWYESIKEQVDKDTDLKEIEERYVESKRIIESDYMLKNLNFEKNTLLKSCPLFKELFKNGFRFLYSEKLSTFYTAVYLYEIDVFGTLTLYRYDVVKDKVKRVETYMVNIEIINKYCDYVISKGL